MDKLFANIKKYGFVTLIIGLLGVSFPHFAEAAGAGGGYIQPPWKEVDHASPGPVARFASAMAYDEDTGNTLLFGGTDIDYDNLNDTWMWDGDRWTDVTPADPNESPLPRIYGEMAYAGPGKGILLFGGNDDAGGIINETWLWDGTNWTEQTEANLPQLSLSNMVFDTRRGQSVLFSGYSEDYLFEKTWTQRISAVSNVGVTSASNAGNAVTDWIVEFETGVYGALAGGSDTITFHAPTGTILPALNQSYTINGAASASITQNTAEEATIALSQIVPANTRVSVAVRGVANPSAGSYNSEDFTAATSQDIVVAPAASGLNLLVPDRIAVEAAPSSVTVGGSVSVTGVVYGVGDLPVSGVEVDFVASSGNFGAASAITDADGRFSTAFMSPSTAGDVTITAVLHANPGVTGTVGVRVNAASNGGSGGSPGGGTPDSGTPPVIVEDPADPADSPGVAEPEPAFTDIAGHWAEADILNAARKGIVTGYPDGSYRPNRTVTRAEFAVMLANALQLRNEGAALIFKDADRIGQWASTAVAQAVNAGLIKGDANGNFRPDALITRSEMAVMLARALGLAADAHSAGFADDRDISAWAVGAAAEMKKLDIMRGKGGNGFFPKDFATRAEAATVLLKMLTAMARK